MDNMNQKTTKPVKVKKKKNIPLILVIVVTVFAAIYIGFALFFQSHFCFGTTLDGIKVGGRSAKQVEQLIKKEINSYTLTLLEREDGMETIAGDSIQAEPLFNGEVEQLIKEQSGFRWIVTLFQKEEVEMEKIVTFDEAALDEVLSDLDCMKPENQREPEDASYSEYTKDAGYVLVPADYGTTIDKASFKQAVVDAVTVLADELDMSEAGCYVEPEIGDDDEGLLALIDQLNHYVGTKVTYDFGDDSEVLDGSIIHEWLSVEQQEAVIDEEAVLAYVKSIAKKYNTAYSPKTLETSYGTTVTISNGSYGWRIDNGGEVEQILADLKEGVEVEREPVYLQTANSHGENDYGDSYVEINLTAQHLFVYENGELIVESDFVSGDASKGHSSPTGAYGLTYKTTDAILRGQDYATPVNYWMPFAGDVGMHDATWRGSFGGGIYLNNGSHGCINLPLSVAKKIYGIVDKGYAVLVYKLPGTESAQVQQQEAASVVNMINSIGTVTLDSEPVIAGARNLYDSLPDTARSNVTNYDILVAAEGALAQLKAEQQAAAQTPQP